MQNNPHTQQKFSALEKLIKIHNQKYNLIAPSTINQIQTRHILDSAQLQKLIPNKSASIIDLGTGAGFPGLILAILGYQNITLLDKNQHKCNFLKIAAKTTQTNPTIIQKAIGEFIATEKQKFQTITARALAPTDKLLPLCLPLMTETSQILLLKGKTHQQEWQQTKPEIKRLFDLETIPSQTDENAAILKLTLLPSCHHEQSFT